MINDITAGISNTLDMLTSGQCIIRTDGLEQLDEQEKPIIYIKFLNIATVRFLRKRHQLRVFYDVAFYPSNLNAENNSLIADAAYNMSEALYQIATPAGKMLKGQDIETQVVDDIAHVSVGYDIFLDEIEKRRLVQTLEQEHYVKG